MAEWFSGRESALLDAIIDGRKTIEGRLNKGKFAQYRPGDSVLLRRDTRDSKGILHDGAEGEVQVEVLAVRKYASFLEMVTVEGYTKVIPNADNAHEAAQIYNHYYSAEDQAKYGVLAIEIRYIAP